MKNRFLILALVAATLFACSSDSMVSDEFNETAEKRKSVPFKAKNIEGTYEFGAGDASCNPAKLIAEGEGTASLLGKREEFEIIEQWCWNGTNEDLGTRSVKFTDENGDYFEGTITSINYPTPLTFIEEVTVAGGTGRFDGASGTFTQHVEISPPQSPTAGTGTFTYNAKGKISY